MQDVQFQPPEKIAQKLLEEIPGQVTSYMQAYGITPSMSAVGCPYDNACAESFSVY